MKRSLLAPVIALAIALPAVAIAQVPQTGHAPLAPGVPTAVRLAASDAEEVTIVRDSWGVPHVYASTTFGIGFGNGHAQASDRLFQLDLLRHVAKADAASLLGPPLLPSDLEIRRELYTDAERQAAADALPAADRALFEGFAAGVNRFVAEAVADPLKMPIEFAALGHPVEAWAVTDTLAIAQFLLDYFGSGGGEETSNAKLLAHLVATLGGEAGRAAFRDVVRYENPLTPPAIPPEDGVYPTPLATFAWEEIPAAQREAAVAAAGAVPFGPGESLASVVPATFRFKFGSNAVLVAPERSASGGSLLGGGPQMSYYSPMIPYEIGLHGAGFDVAGIGVGGAPGVVIGRTAAYSWTVTSGFSDQVDVVGVKLVPGNPRRYVHAGSERDMECRVEIHVVKAPPPTSAPAAQAYPAPDVVRQEACRTVYGPVFAINDGAGWAFSKHRAHRNLEVASGVRWLTLGQRSDLAGFRDAISDFAFSFNFHYADRDHVFFQHVGHQPERDARLDPRLPRPGTGEFDWRGVKTGDALPHVLDPSQGWIVNWNNAPQRGWPSGDAREVFGSVHRVDLLRERLLDAFERGGGKVAMDDVARVVREAGSRDAFARHTVPFLLDATATGGTDRAVVEAARDALAAWKRRDYDWSSDASGTYDPAHAIYDEWRSRLQERVFRDELGPFASPMEWEPATSGDVHAADHGTAVAKDALLVDAIEGRTRVPWCHDVRSARVAPITCGEQARAAFVEALDALASRFNSTDVPTWRMKEHLNVYVTMNAGPAFSHAMMNRASFNHLHDWGVDGDRAARSVLPPGAGAGYYPPLRFAGYLATGETPPHARDQLDLYVRWEHKPFGFFREDVEAGGATTTLHTIVPTGAAAAPPTP